VWPAAPSALRKNGWGWTTGVASVFVLRLWLKSLPFVSRWFDAAPAACCGMCGPCVTATVTGLTVEAVAAKRDRD
jgi:hypothetical protein